MCVLVWATGSNDFLYVQYFKMLQMGLPRDAVKHALKRDAKDPGVLDLDPEKSLKSQQKADEDDGPPLKEDPEYTKVRTHTHTHTHT